MSVTVSVLVPYVNKVCLLCEQSMSVYRTRRKRLVYLADHGPRFSRHAKNSALEAVKGIPPQRFQLTRKMRVCQDFDAARQWIR